MIGFRCECRAAIDCTYPKCNEGVEVSMASVTGESGLMASAKNRLHLQSKKIGELNQQLSEARSHPTIEACRQMIEAQAVKENEELRQQLADMTAERDTYMRDYGKEQDRKREVAQKLAAAQIQSAEGWRGCANAGLKRINFVSR